MIYFFIYISVCGFSFLDLFFFSAIYLFAKYPEQNPSLHFWSFLISVTARNIFKCSNERVGKFEKIETGSDKNENQISLAVTVIRSTQVLPEVQVN